MIISIWVTNCHSQTRQEICSTFIGGAYRTGVTYNPWWWFCKITNYIINKKQCTRKMYYKAKFLKGKWICVEGWMLQLNLIQIMVSIASNYSIIDILIMPRSFSKQRGSSWRLQREIKIGCLACATYFTISVK